MTVRAPYMEGWSVRQPLAPGPDTGAGRARASLPETPLRRTTLTAAALATLFLAGGCSDEPEANRPSPTTATASAGKPAQAPATQPPSLDLPENARTLVAETTGNRNQELPEFTPQEGAYTL
ncbi:putative component of type VI protein secretion system [Streptomyces albogriseolus]